MCDLVMYIQLRDNSIQTKSWFLAEIYVCVHEISILKTRLFYTTMKTKFYL
jgi:hypothetical protein